MFLETGDITKAQGNVKAFVCQVGSEICMQRKGSVSFIYIPLLHRFPGPNLKIVSVSSQTLF